LLEVDIAQALRQRGYATVSPVGSGPNRVDLAVVDQDNPHRFVLGILCDGPMYHAATTARDRDRLRPEVLGHLGWSLHHVWAPAWVGRRQQEIDRLMRAVEQARLAVAARPSRSHSAPALAAP
jgi:hypothetical protein